MVVGVERDVALGIYIFFLKKYKHLIVQQILETHSLASIVPSTQQTAVSSYVLKCPLSCLVDE